MTGSRHAAAFAATELGQEHARARDRLLSRCPARADAAGAGGCEPDEQHHPQLPDSSAPRAAGQVFRGIWHDLIGEAPVRVSAVPREFLAAG